MRNRTNYNYTPAASSRVVHRKPAPRRPRTNWNQLLLVLFFILLPLLALLSLFFAPMKWVFVIMTCLTLVLMWMQHGFVLRGRLIMTTLYGILAVMTLSSVLSPSNVPANNRPYTTIAPIAPTPTPTSGLNPAVASLLQSQDGTGDTDTGTTADGTNALAVQASSGSVVNAAPGTSAAEIALDQFLRCWQMGVMDDLVQYTPPSWQQANNPPKQKLFYKFNQKQLQSWEVQGVPSGTDADGSRTVTVIVSILYNGREERTLSCDALMIKENGEWYVDPDSLSNGTTVVVATPEPQAAEATPLPFETPEPTKKPTSKTKLYYNKNGGQYYHADERCPSVLEKYLPLTSFTYGQLNDKPYNQLKPCTRCKAPERPTDE